MMSKKQVRENFRNSVYKRDKNTCQVCNKKHLDTNELDAHHITDRSEMPNGGYVKENGITVCKDECHFKVELFHITEGEEWNEGLHPDDLYKKIKSSKELAIKKSHELEV
jgi:5-methylcytosine-specific restriction endonuclease McrA